MHAFYHPQIALGINELSKEESHHMLKVLRMPPGSEVRLLDGKGAMGFGKLVEGSKSCAKIEIENIEKQEAILPRIRLYLCPPKSGDRLDFILEKATELGVAEIHFIQARNSERKAIKLDKLEQKVVAACKQSLNAHFPVLHDLLTLHSIKQEHLKDALICHCQDGMERKGVKELELSKQLNLFIGPEGDFSKDEVAYLYQQGSQGYNLGPQRLRTETAVIAAIVQLQMRGM